MTIKEQKNKKYKYKKERKKSVAHFNNNLPYTRNLRKKKKKNTREKKFVFINIVDFVDRIIDPTTQSFFVWPSRQHQVKRQLRVMVSI